MTLPRSNAILSVSDRVYRALLRAYPARFREEYGPHMAQVFRDCCREAEGRSGPPGVAGLWLSTLGDLAATALAERISERRGWEMSRSRLISWSGAASIAGGGLWLLWSFALWLGPLLALALLLWLVGLAGLHAQQARHNGWLRWTGLVLAFAGDLVALPIAAYLSYALVATNSVLITEPNAVFVLFLLGMASLCAGLVLLGFVALRAKVLSCWRALPLIVGLLVAVQITWGWAFIFFHPDPPLTVVAPWFALGVLVGVGWTGLGYALLSGTGEAAAQPALASA